MLLAKINFNQLRNFKLSQNFKLFPIINSQRAITTTCFLQTQKENQPKILNETYRIYHGSLSSQIRAVKVFSLSTSLVGVLAQPMLYDQASKLGTSTPVIVVLCGFIGFFTFITPFLIHMITKKYITELHYDPNSKEYIATVITFFLTKKQHKFTPNDVIVPDVPGMFTTFLLKTKNDKKGIPLFFDPRLFEDPSHYVKIMGYDKPIDFQLNQTDENEKK